MGSVLTITSVENLQKNIDKTVKSFEGTPGIYVSLNKTQTSTEDHLVKQKIDVEKLFFIDCVTDEKTKEDVLHIPPDNLGMLSTAIREFINDIQGSKFLVIDALSTLLIYNSNDDVAKFAKEVTEFASANDVKVVAFSPKTKGEELLDKIFNFFDKVKKGEK